MRLPRFALMFLLLAGIASTALAQGPPGIPTQVQTRQLTLLPQSPVAPVTNVNATPSVQGNTTYYYWFVSYVGGVASAPAGPFLANNAPATLGGINTITLKWTPVSGATAYDVLRTTSSAAPSGVCGCAVSAAVTLTQLVDNAPSTSAYTVNTPQSQIPCTITNLAMTCSGSGSGTPSIPVLNVKAVPFNAKGDTITDAGHMEGGGVGNCPPADSVCIVSNDALFKTSDVGKTLWGNEATSGINRTVASPILHVYSASEVDTTYSVTDPNGPKPLSLITWGTDDTPAIAAAAAQGQANGGTVYFPCGNYMFTGPALVQPANFAGFYSIEGENESCVQFIPSPTLSLTGVPVNAGAVVNFTAQGARAGNFTIFGADGNFLGVQANADSLVNLQGRTQQVSNIKITDTESGAAQLNVTDQDSTLTGISVLNPTQSPGFFSSGDMCDFNANINVVVIDVLCSNSVGTSSADLRVSNTTPTQTGFSLTFEGGLIDECGETTAGADGANAACTIVTNSQHVAFHNTIMWGGGNGVGSPALSVDGTSDVILDAASLGPFNTNSTGGVHVAAGGILRTSQSQFRASGGGFTAVNNLGTIFFGNGNNVSASNGATAFAGNAPVFTTTQSSPVTAGHIATWTGSLGGLQDGGATAQTIQSNSFAQLGADVSLTVNTITPILTQAVTFPASGCPCRVLISYDLYETSSNATFDTWVADSSGTPNIIAQTQIAQTNTNVGGITGSQTSPNTYANSASVTFTLDTTSTVTGAVIKSAATANPASGTPQKSWMSISVLTSN